MRIRYLDLVRQMDRIHILRRCYMQKATSGEVMHFKQLPILVYVAKHDGCTQNDLAEALSVTPACIATSTKRLQKAGLITKTVNKDNMRQNLLHITPEGEAEREKYKSMFDRLDKRMFDGLSEEELQFLYDVLFRLEKNLMESMETDRSGPGKVQEWMQKDEGRKENDRV